MLLRLVHFSTLALSTALAASQPLPPPTALAVAPAGPPPPHSPPPAPPPNAFAALAAFGNATLGAPNLALNRPLSYSSCGLPSGCGNVTSARTEDPLFTAALSGSSKTLQAAQTLLTGAPFTSPLPSLFTAAPPPAPRISCSGSSAPSFQSRNFSKDEAVNATAAGELSTLDVHPWLQVDLGAQFYVTAIEAWFGSNLTVWLQRPSATLCQVNLYVSSTTKLANSSQSPTQTFAPLDLATRPSVYHRCAADVGVNSVLPYALIGNCSGTLGRYITVQLAPPSGYTTCSGASGDSQPPLTMCQLVVLGAAPAVPSPPEWPLKKIEAVALPCGFFLLLAIPLAVYAVLRYIEYRRRLVLDHWPVVLPKKLVADDFVVVKSPTAFGSPIDHEPPPPPPPPPLDLWNVEHGGADLNGHAMGTRGAGLADVYLRAHSGQQMQGQVMQGQMQGHGQHGGMVDVALATPGGYGPPGTVHANPMAAYRSPQGYASPPQGFGSVQQGYGGSPLGYGGQAMPASPPPAAEPPAAWF